MSATQTSEPEGTEPETDSKKHPNAVHFTVDGEPLEIETNSLKMSEILALVGKKPDQWYLVEKVGEEQRHFRDPDEDITVSDHAKFVAEERRHLVEVALEITTEDGDTQTVAKTIESGTTEVTVLKTELGVPEEASLWVIRKDGKKKQLANHEKHDVKEGDRYQTIIPGGVS
jgi:hypothetical protein